MKKHFLIIVLIISATIAFSQDKHWHKALSLYKNHQYDKTIQYTQKNLDRSTAKPGLYYLLGLCNFYIAQTMNKPADKMVRIKRAVNYIYQGLRHDKDSTYYNLLKDDMKTFRDSLYAYMKHYNNLNDTRDTRFFAQSIVSLYHDTTDIYREIFQPNQQEQPEPGLKEKQQALVASYQGPTNMTDALGRRQGMWIAKYPDGTIKYMIYFKDGHPAGTFKRFYPNGQLQVDMKYEITGHRAAAIFYDQDGHRIAMGYYYNRKRDSLWQFFVDDTIVIREVFYKNGLKNGPDRIYSYYYYPNLLRERYWKNDTLDSVAVDYYYDGTPKSFSYYKHGVLDGPYTLLDYTRKVKVKGQYVNGYMEGKWLFYNPDGSADTVEYHLGEPTNPAMTEAESKIIKAIEESKSRYPEPAEIFKKQYGLEDW